MISPNSKEAKSILLDIEFSTNCESWDSSEAYIYFMEVPSSNTSYLKIGRCKKTVSHLIERYRECSRWCPDARLIGFFEGEMQTEKVMHQLLDEKGLSVDGGGKELFVKNDFTLWLANELCQNTLYDMDCAKSNMIDAMTEYFYSESSHGKPCYNESRYYYEELMADWCRFDLNKGIPVLIGKKEQSDFLLNYFVHEKEYEDDPEPLTKLEILDVLMAYKPIEPELDFDCGF